MSRVLATLAIVLVVSCTSPVPEEETLEVRFREIAVKSAAVSKVRPLVVSNQQPVPAHLSPAHLSLFTYLAETQAADLVSTKSHSQGKWRIEKVFLLDDCVAVQMTEGHYLETLFFVQYTEGWRLKARIVPEDHL
jgi:hypothetical protein